MASMAGETAVLLVQLKTAPGQSGDRSPDHACWAKLIIQVLYDKAVA